MNDNRFCSEPMCMAYGIKQIGDKNLCGQHASAFVDKCLAIAYEETDCEVDDETEMLISLRMERDVRMV